MVHLSHVRLPAPALRLHRGGDAFAVQPEYEIHRPLYDWFLENLGIFHSRQIEFARLNLTHTVMSKRWLLELVKEGTGQRLGRSRMPTLVGLRRRGYTPEAHPGFRLARGDVQDGEHRGHRASGALPAGGPQPALPQGHGRAATR